MGKILRIAAAILVLAVAGFWIAAGHNTGWTRTSVAQTRKDPVTDIEYQVYEKKFLPGVDFLACGIFLAVTLGGVSLFFRPKQQPQPSAN